MTNKPFGLLTVGNVVNAALRLYGANVKKYLRLSIFAHLWLLLAIFVLVEAIFVIITLAASAWIVAGICIVNFAIFVYSLAQFYLKSALIARLCFDELIEQPESNSEGRSQVNKKFWSFLVISIGINIRLLLVYLGFYVLLMAIAIGIILITGDTGFLARIVIALVFIALLLAATYINFRLATRWIVAELALAVEPDFNSSKSVKRSWELTKASINRIQGIITVAFLVTIPIEAIALVISEFILIAVESVYTTDWATYIISTIFSLVGSAVVMPFWQAIKAVIYYDLRNRREGLDLQLRKV